MVPPVPVPRPEAETVVLLHGIGLRPITMGRIARRLRCEGYEVRNLGYPSRQRPIEELASETLEPIFAAGAPAGTIHLVTHSMGGLLVRQFLHGRPRPAQLGRIVMIAPPNGGSEIADRLRSWWFYRWYFGPAGQQLGTDLLSRPNQLGSLPGLEVGILAGDRGLIPLFRSWIGEPCDGEVSVRRTRLEGMKDHRVIHASHTALLWRRETIDEIVEFLKNGRFSPDPRP